MKVFRQLVFIYLLLTPLFAFGYEPGGNTLKGKITDTAGNKIIGAVVTIPDLKVGAVSDTNGNYIIENLPKGSYLVQVHMISFATAAERINLSGTITKDFRLKESIIERNEVVITGTSLATERKRSTTPIQTIRITELQENASSNIVDAIAKLPGVSQATTGPAISKPIIRGLGSNRVLTISEGIRQEGQQWGDEHGIEVDDYNVSRVEVLKGPASLSYGSDALAGVVNIISKEDAPEGRITGNINLNYQANNGLAAGHADLQGNSNGFVWGGYFSGKMAHDYKNKYDGYVYNSRFKNANYGASVGLKKSWGNSRLSFTSFNQTLGIVEGERDSATGAFIKIVNDHDTAAELLATDEDGKSYSLQLPAQRIEHQKLAWNNDIYLHNGGRIGVNLGYQQNTRKEFEEVVDPETPGLYFLLKTINYDVKYFFPVINGWQITSGVNGMKQDNENKGEEFLVPDYSLFDIGVYSIVRKDWKSWSLSGGVRIDQRKFKGEDLFVDSTGERTSELENGGSVRFAAFDRSFSNVSGSIGASYSVNDRLTFKANLSSGYRSPNIAELSANGVHEGTIRYEYGNVDLKPETSYQADLGVEYNSDHVYLNAAIFFNCISNFIYIRKLTDVNGNDSIPEANNEEGFPAFIYDQSNANLYGGEFFLDLHPHPLDWLHFENTFSYVRGKRSGGTDSTENLPYIPPARWLSEIRVQKNNSKGMLNNTYAKIGMEMVFDQNNVFSAFGTETPTKGYTIVNAGAGTDFTNNNNKVVCSLSLSIQNLFDVGYQNHLSRLKYASVNNVTGREGVFNMGRNISLLLSVPFNLK
jgi:iron complex outermembrane recepter protein